MEICSFISFVRCIYENFSSSTGGSEHSDQDLSTAQGSNSEDTLRNFLCEMTK